MKFNIKWLLYLPILFFFLPGFSFYLPGLKGIYKFFYISLYFSFVVIFIFDKKYFINKLINICKKTPLIYFVVFLLFIALNSLLLSLFGITTISQTIRSIIMQIILCILPTIIYFIYIVKKYIGLKKFIKIFMFLFWINLVLGLIAYFGRWFEITIINSIFDFLNNARTLEIQILGAAAGQTPEISFQLEKRLCGLFEEPGYLGQFLFIFLPFVYTFSGTKVKLYNNNIFNKIFKITLVPLTWINIILTLSPITLVFAGIISFIYYFQQILNLIKKYYIVITVLIYLIIAIVKKIDFSETYIARIINIIINIHSFEDFILIEPSLATRVASYINEFQIFLHHPFTGVGIGNLKNYMYAQFLNSPVPLTPEIITKTKLIIQMGGGAMFNIGFMYALLAENGIFAYSILVCFYIKIFYFINKFKNKANKYSYEYLIFKSLHYTMFCLLILSFYNLNFISQYLHLLIAISVISIYEFKIIQRNNEDA